MSSCAIIHDRDNDGDLDIALTDEGDDVILIYDNPGVINTIKPLPVNLAFIQTYPNPFTEQLSISYDLKEASHIQLAVYNLQGQQVAKLDSGFKASGEHLLDWNGTNGDEKKLAGGTYLLTIKTDKGEVSRKISLQ